MPLYPIYVMDTVIYLQMNTFTILFKKDGGKEKSAAVFAALWIKCDRSIRRQAKRRRRTSFR